LHFAKCSAIAERPRCRVRYRLVLANSGRLELRDNIYGRYSSIFNQSKACMRLPISD